MVVVVCGGGEWCRYIFRLFTKMRWPSKCERCKSKKASANECAQVGGCEEGGIHKGRGSGDIRVGSSVG